MILSCATQVKLNHDGTTDTTEESSNPTVKWVVPGSRNKTELISFVVFVVSLWLLPYCSEILKLPLRCRRADALRQRQQRGNIELLGTGVGLKVHFR